MPIRVMIHGIGGPKAWHLRRREMLSEIKIKAAKPRPKPYKVSDGGRLLLLVPPNGGKL